MTPGRIAGATRRLGPPRDWDLEKNGECDHLEIVDREGTMESVWYPSPEELAALNRGEPVHLTVWGESHPPVALSVQI